MRLLSESRERCAQPWMELAAKFKHPEAQEQLPIIEKAIKRHADFFLK
jgi:hypothetical protein